MVVGAGVAVGVGAGGLGWACLLGGLPLRVGAAGCSWRGNSCWVEHLALLFSPVRFEAAVFYSCRFFFFSLVISYRDI